MDQPHHAQTGPAHVHGSHLERHGQRLRLHDRLTEVCEDFVRQPVSQKYRQNTLVRELEYLASFYKDEENWHGVP